jgi:serine/threonine-protein kinase
MPTLERGANFDGHRIVRLLGEGKGAEVFEAIAPSTDDPSRLGPPGGKRCALKILKDLVPIDAIPNRRLHQQAEAEATIQHVNIVRFEDVGIFEGRVWLRSELVDGLDLRRLAAALGGKLPVEHAIELIRQAAEGMAAAHELGIIHRDLKPENLLVALRGGPPSDPRPENILPALQTAVVKVADWDSVKFPRWGVQTAMTETVGAARYQPPEYLRDRVVGKAMDVYALAIVLYEMCTGVHPIVHGQATIFEVVMRQLTHEPTPLVALLGNLEDPHGYLSVLLQRNMAKDPAARDSMRRFANELAGILGRSLPQVQRRQAARSLPLPNLEPALAATESPTVDWRSVTPPPAAPSFGSTPRAGTGGAFPMPSSATGGTIPMSAVASSGRSEELSAPHDTERTGEVASTTPAPLPVSDRVRAGGEIKPASSALSGPPDTLRAQSRPAGSARGFFTEKLPTVTPVSVTPAAPAGQPVRSDNAAFSSHASVSPASAQSWGPGQRPSAGPPSRGAVPLAGTVPMAGDAPPTGGRQPTDHALAKSSPPPSSPTRRLAATLLVVGVVVVLALFGGWLIMDRTITSARDGAAVPSRSPAIGTPATTGAASASAPAGDGAAPVAPPAPTTLPPSASTPPSRSPGTPSRPSRPRR